MIKVHLFDEAVASYLLLYKMDGLEFYSERLQLYSRRKWFAEEDEGVWKQLSEMRKSIGTKMVKIKLLEDGCVLCATIIGGMKHYVKAEKRNSHNETPMVRAQREMVLRHFSKLVADYEERKWKQIESYGVKLTEEECLLMQNQAFAWEILLGWAAI